MNRRSFIAGLFMVALLGGCQNEPIQPPAGPLPPVPANVPPGYAKFHGIWSGRWDDVWSFTFVIEEVTPAGRVSGHYYWKEHMPGPWSHRTVSGQIHGDSVKFNVITFTIDETYKNHAVAVGRFPTNTRTADLTKQHSVKSAKLLP